MYSCYTWHVSTVHYRCTCENVRLHILRATPVKRDATVAITFRFNTWFLRITKYEMFPQMLHFHAIFNHSNIAGLWRSRFKCTKPPSFTCAHFALSNTIDLWQHSLCFKMATGSGPGLIKGWQSRDPWQRTKPQDRKITTVDEGSAVAI